MHLRRKEDMPGWNPLVQAELESMRIKKNLCPKCGAPIVDKGIFLMCGVCSWTLTNGIWDGESGCVIDRSIKDNPA